MRFIISSLVIIFLQIVAARTQTADSLGSSAFSHTNIKATVQVESHEVPLNRTVVFFIKVSWQGNLNRFEILKLETPVLTNLKLLSNSSSNWVSQKETISLTEKNYEFELQPEEMGMAYIDGAIIEYKDNITGDTQRLTTNRIEIKIIDPIIERDWPALLMPVAVVMLLVITAMAAVVYWRRKKAKEAQKKAAAITEIPLEDVFLVRLKEKIDLQSQELSDPFSDLSSLLRKYLSQKCGVQAMGMATVEITDALNRYGLDAPTIKQIQEILTASDVAKFSGGQVDRSSLERAYTIFEQLLEQSRISAVESS